MEFNERNVGALNLAIYPAGVLFGTAFLISEVAEVKNPALAANIFSSPTFLCAMTGYLYFLFCVYKLHSYFDLITMGVYPINPKKAAFFHLIPFYGVYWPIKWTKEIFISLHARDEKRKSLNKYGILISASIVLARFDAGIAQIIMFVSLTMISRIIVSEYEAGGLTMMNKEQQEVGRKLVL